MYHLCGDPAPFEPDVGDDPDLYGHVSSKRVRECRRTVVVIT